MSFSFREYLELQEAEQRQLNPYQGFTGPLLPTPGFGSNKPHTLNYGGARESTFPPFLYVPLTRAEARKPLRFSESKEPQHDFDWTTHLKSVRKGLKKRAVTCWPDSSHHTGWKCVHVGEGIRKKDGLELGSLGEAHVTIALGDELAHALPSIIRQYNLPPHAGIKDVLAAVRINDQPLFARGTGMPVPIAPNTKSNYDKYNGISGHPEQDRFAGEHQKEIVFGVAQNTVVPNTDKHPIVALLPVKVPSLNAIRQALHLEPRSESYTPHATIGYAVPNPEHPHITTVGARKEIPKKGLRTAPKMATDALRQAFKQAGEQQPEILPFEPLSKF